MKKYIYILLALCFILTGCSSKDSNNKVIQESNSSKEVLDKVLKNKISNTNEWNCEIELNNIVDISDWGKFITKDGDIYEYNFYQKYSTTGNNCKKIDTNIKFNRFIHEIGISNDGKLYGFYDDKIEIRPFGYTGAFDYNAYDYDNNVILLFMDTGFDVYGVIKNNVIYKLSGSMGKYNGLEELYKFEDGEEFLSMNGKYIKSNKAFYRYSIVNRKECNEYADVECKYGIVRDDELTKEYDKIQYINDTFLILKNDSNNIYALYER